MDLIRKIISTIYLSTLVVFAYSQDIHFSQFLKSPLHLNPSLGGNHNAEWRLTDIYRTQWFTIKYPFHSHYISFDKQIYLRKAKFNVGLGMANDVSGDAVLGVSKYFFNLSWHPKIKTQHLNIGIQAGYVIKSFNPERLTFPDQYDNLTGYYDISLGHQDASVPVKLNYPLINSGISWNTKFGKIYCEAGFSLFNINMPVESFISNSNKLKMRKLGYARVIIPFSNDWNLMPAAYFTEINKASEMLNGFNFYKNINNQNNSIRQLGIGVYSRNGFKRNVDAVVLTGFMSYRKLELGMAYDLNISGLRKYSSYQGAIELSVIYMFFHPAHDKFLIPCERY